MRLKLLSETVRTAIWMAIMRGQHSGKQQLNLVAAAGGQLPDEKGQQ